MRTIAEWSLALREPGRAPLKATLMHWNQKYVVRVESGPLEQIYKLEALDFSSADDLKARLDDAFADACEKTFASMRAELAALYSAAR